MAIVFALAALAIVPAPQKMFVSDGAFTTNLTVTYARDAKIPAEGYRLKVMADGIMVWSSDDAGRFYAEMTLKQLDDAGRCPIVEIEDAPRFAWRGVHIDDCRHFFGKETVKKTMDLMAQHKLNVLHWHLTDDQGWRLDVPKHPELAKYGSVRSQSVRRHRDVAVKDDKNKFNGVTYGPYYYTEADIKEILDYAAVRYIKVVPEIELPGHVQAALAAHPEFACRPENVSNRDPRISWGVSEDVLCVGNDDAIKLFEDVFDYVCRLFPSDVVHIGGDECPQVRWKTCPKCQARIKAEGLNDEHGLQPWLTRHFVKFLEAHGKRTIGWDEYLLGDVPPSAIGMWWRVGNVGVEQQRLSLKEIAEKGHDIVMTPFLYCYLDYAQGIEDDPYMYLGTGVTLEKSYSFDPCAEVPENLRPRGRGGQGNNWAEFTWNEHDLMWKMWPRMCALAEVFWTGENRPGFADFKQRMQTHRKRLIAQHVNCAPIE